MLKENNTLNNYIELYRKTNTFKTKKGNTQKRLYLSTRSLPKDCCVW